MFILSTTLAAYQWLYFVFQWLSLRWLNQTDSRVIIHGPDPLLFKNLWGGKKLSNNWGLLKTTDYVHTKMQVSNCVMKSVLFPIFTIAKLMSRLAYTWIFSSTISGVTSIFRVWLAKNEWHLNVFNILCNHNNSLEILKETFGSFMNVCPLIHTQYCVSKTQTPKLGMSLSKIFLALNPISACYTLWRLEATVFNRQRETGAAWWEWSCESNGKH